MYKKLAFLKSTTALLARLRFEFLENRILDSLCNLFLVDFCAPTSKHSKGCSNAYIYLPLSNDNVCAIYKGYFNAATYAKATWIKDSHRGRRYIFNKSRYIQNLHSHLYSNKGSPIAYGCYLKTTRDGGNRIISLHTIKNDAAR